MNWFVLDASIALAWCFPDENDTTAEHVAGMFADNAIASVTSFWPQEVLNALLAGEKRKRISKELITIFLDDLAQLSIIIDKPQPMHSVFVNIQSLCREYGLTSYDASYLELAIRNNLPLATLDKELQNAALKTGITLIKP